MARFESKNINLSTASLLLAGTLFIAAQPAQAANADRLNARLFRQNNPGMSARELRRSLRETINTPRVRNVEIGKGGGTLANNNNSKPMNIRVNRRDPGSIHFTKASFQTGDTGRVLRMNNGIDLDLGSTDRNITLGGKLFTHTGEVVIELNGEKKTFTAGAEVTAAEYVAIKQVLAGGSQTVKLDGNGRCVGGEVDFSAISQRGDKMRVDDLSLPANLVTYGDFGKRNTFNVTGDLTNAGTLYAYSSGKGNHAGEIRAENITNEAGALITTLLPEDVAIKTGNVEPKVDLSLKANDTFNNFGTISSSGDLSIGAGEVLNNQSTPAGQALMSAEGNLNLTGKTINNNGLLKSSNGNINIDTPIAAELNVHNEGGTMEALNGAINLRSLHYNDGFNTNLTGGKLLSKELNVNSGQGTADISVDEVTGTINEKGLASHVETLTGDLNLGNICLTGDPTYKNANGDIVIKGNISVGERLVFIASGDIYNSKEVLITASTPSTGYSITFIAGAEILSGGTNTTSVGPNLPGGVDTTLSGKASSTGGNITLGVNGKVTIDTRASNLTGNKNGGDVNFYALGKSDETQGRIDIGNATIRTGGAGAGANGDVVVMAGGGDTGLTVPTIKTGEIDTTGGIFGGDVLIQCAQPTSDGGDIKYLANGSMAAGSAQWEAKSLIVNNADIEVTGNITSSSKITMYCGGGNATKIHLNDDVKLKTIGALGTVKLYSLFNSDIIQEASSFIDTENLTLYSFGGHIGSIDKPILTNAKHLTVTNKTGDGFVKDSNSGLTFVQGEIDNLTLTTQGTMHSEDGGMLKALWQLNLKSINGSIGLSHDNAMQLDAFAVNLNAKGDVYARNNNMSINGLNGSNSAGGTFDYRANGAFVMPEQLKATTIEFRADGLMGANGNHAPAWTATKQISITCMNSMFNTDWSALNFVTPLLKLYSVTGDIGTKNDGFKVGAGVKSIYASSSEDVYLSSTAAGTKGANLVGGHAVGDFEFKGAGNVLVSGNVTTDVGNLSIIAAKGKLTVNPNVTLESHKNLLLQVADDTSSASKSKIVIGKNAKILTDSPAGFGDVMLYVGKVTAPVAGTAPASGVAYAENGGDIYWGVAGLSAKSPVNTLYAKGADIIINNPFKNTNISLGGNVGIVADPPVANNNPVWIFPGTKNVSSVLDLPVKGEGQSVLSTSPMQFDMKQSLPMTMSTRLETNRSIMPSIDLGFAQDDDSVINQSNALEPQAKASFYTHGHLHGVSGHAIANGNVAMENGHAVFAPSEDTVIETEQARVSLKAGALVIVSRTEHGVAVYNLHDDKKQSVLVQVGDRTHALIPGQHLMVAHGHKQFGSVNTIKGISHRALMATEVGTKTVYSSEFSITSALGSVDVLDQIAHSSKPEARKLTGKVIKTAAVLMSLDPSSDAYHQYDSQQLTASIQ